MTVTAKVCPVFLLVRLLTAASLQVYALEIEEYMQDFARPFFQEAGVEEKVKHTLGGTTDDGSLPYWAHRSTCHECCCMFCCVF
jgi:hypothetical protein